MQTRDVPLNIGKGVYTVSTPLSDEELDRVKVIISEACGGVRKDVRQEDILVLAVLRLAWNLETVRIGLEGLCELIQEEDIL